MLRGSVMTTSLHVLGLLRAAHLHVVQRHDAVRVRRVLGGEAARVVQLDVERAQLREGGAQRARVLLALRVRAVGLDRLHPFLVEDEASQCVNIKIRG